MSEGYFQPFRTGASSSGGASSAQPVVGGEAQQLVDMLHGKHYADALAGRVFSQSCTPLGLAIPIYTATAIAGGMPIWNPPGSGVNVELISVNLARGSGTADFGAVGVMARELAAIATGAIMTALAETTPFNGKLFGGNKTKTRSSNAGTCTVSAGVAGDWVRTLATINLEADTGTAHATSIAHFDFDGTLVVPPGVLVYLAATKASVALYASTVVWKEIPT
jgi:hypothetical protein